MTQKNALFLKLCRHSLLAIALLYAGTGFAATPDAGSILKQIERELEKYITPKKPPKKEKEEPKKTQVEGNKFIVKHFNFEGNKLIRAEELEQSLKIYLNKEITLEELKLAVGSLSNFYRNRGYLAQAVLPPPKILQMASFWYKSKKLNLVVLN